MRKPEWIKVRLPQGREFERINRILSFYRLKTVCSSARCPNLGDCWGRGTATVMILGDLCTRHCRFCGVKSGNPQGRVDEDEPLRVAKAVKELGWRYVVLTSVDRDDLADFGARIFAQTVRLIREFNPEVRVEVLIPDFNLQEEMLRMVVCSGPDVLGHNIETVARLTPQVRDKRAGYQKSLQVLKMAKEIAPHLITKSGLMVGLGETEEEVVATLRDLRAVNCDIVTIGQYLQPGRGCLPVLRYYDRNEFQRIAEIGIRLGFKEVFAGPLVRSSFRAEAVFEQIRCNAARE